MDGVAAYKACRSTSWAKIYDTLRAYRLSNMADEDGNPYPLVDAVSPPDRSIAEGEAQMIILADEISLALEALDPTERKYASRRV